jgi:phosphoribosyl 1,2-cyclic phosphodiesterase
MPHFLFAPLGSGSKGNAYVISYNGQTILVDAGLSNRRMTWGLLDLGIDPDSLLGVFVTHDHKDHYQGLIVASEKHPWPIYGTPDTISTVRYFLRDPKRCHTFNNTRRLELGPFKIEAFKISHDTIDPVAYRISIGNFTMGVCTDLGKSTTIVEENLKGLNLLVLEANHDLDMLLRGPYPDWLIQRIRSAKGHLSNVQSGELLRELVHPELKHVILGHLSEENNKPKLALDTVAKSSSLPKHVKLELAMQHDVGPVIEMDF